MSQSKYTNIAFISYKREDEELVKWLQNKLEHYKLPTEITKETPDMRPYSDLEETEKEYDRIMAMQTLKLVQKMGFKIVRDLRQ